jgi:hypothetical protein
MIDATGLYYAAFSVMTRSERKIAGANIPPMVLQHGNSRRPVLVRLWRGLFGRISPAPSHHPAADDFEIIWDAQHGVA